LIPESLAALLAISGAIAIAGNSFGAGFPLDDAWIHMVYGAALRHVGALQYNDGYSSTGCTSPTWAMLVALAHFVSAARGPSLLAATCVQVLGIGLHAAEAVLAARLLRAWTPKRSWAAPLAVGAGALVACAPTHAYGAASGMEVPLEGSLLLGTLLAASRRRWMAAGVLAGVAAVTRPEAVLAVVTVAGLALLGERFRVAVRTLGIGLAIVGVRVTRDLLVSGRPLPATFYVKAKPHAQPSARALARGLVDVLGSMRPASHGVLWLFLVLALGVGAVAIARRLRGRRGARRQYAIGAAAALGLAYAASMSAISYMQLPHVFYYQRYLVPPFTLMIVAGLAGAAWLTRYLLRSKPAHGPWVLLLLAAVGVADEIEGWRADRARFADDVASINALQVTIGQWVDTNLPPSAVVWTVDAGAVRYWGRRRTVDLIRLNTPELFDGSKVRKAWWPSAIALISNLFQIVTPEPLLDSVLVVQSRGLPGEREAARHEVYRCRSDADRARDNRVIVFRDRSILMAVGRCVP
jgi:hypothetical protein